MAAMCYWLWSLSICVAVCQGPMAAVCYWLCVSVYLWQCVAGSDGCRVLLALCLCLSVWQCVAGSDGCGVLLALCLCLSVAVCDRVRWLRCVIGSVVYLCGSV